MDQEGQKSYYYIVIFFIIALGVNVFVLIAYFENPINLVKELESLRPRYLNQTLPNIANFSQITENDKFKELKKYPDLKLDFTSRSNPFKVLPVAPDKK
jgi:hypothetical protein